MSKQNTSQTNASTGTRVTPSRTGAPRARERVHAAGEIKDGIEHEAVTTIMAPAAQIYQYWRELNNLPTFMKNLKSIEVKSSRLSHWKWSALHGQVEVEWDSEITHDEANRLIAWKSTEGSTVAHTGEVSFDELPHGRGTEVRVILHYHPPGGKVTDFIERVLGESPTLIQQENLRRLRGLMEVGRIPTTEGQSRGGMPETLNPKLHGHH